MPSNQKKTSFDVAHSLVVGREDSALKSVLETKFWFEVQFLLQNTKLKVTHKLISKEIYLEFGGLTTSKLLKKYKDR